MALVFDTPEGPIEVHELVVQAVVRHAEFQAQVVAVALRAMGHVPESGQACSFPAGFLLELAAIAQIKQWEMDGLREFIDADLPTFAEAAADLHARAVASPADFDAVANLALSGRVVEIWYERFAWDAPDLLQAEFLVDRIDDNALVNAFAKLLWSLRHLADDREPNYRRQVKP
jgi:hypothetical protein